MDEHSSLARRILSQQNMEVAMFDRMIRAVRLDRTLFRMVADNPEYMNESIILAVVVSLVAALGSLATPDGFRTFLFQFFNGLIFGWALWALVAYFVGTTFFKGRSSPSEMLRTLAYAGVPRILGVFAFVPCIGWLAALAGGILSIIAGVIAIRESMEFDTTSAVVTAIIGFLLYLVATVVIGMVLAPATGLLGQ
jgi:hypothetical protein